MGEGDMEGLKRGKGWNTKNYVTTLLICEILKNLIELKSFTNFCNEVGLKKYWQRKHMNQTGTDLKSSILTSSLMV